MTSKTSLGHFAAALLAAGVGSIFVGPVWAQSVWPADKPALEAGPGKNPDSAAADDAEADKPDSDDIMKDIDVSKLDWSQLNVDASTLSDEPATMRTAPRKAQQGDDLAWSNKAKDNGASDVSVKQSVSPLLDTRVGADMTVTRAPTTMSELLADKAANGGSEPQSGGSAWAAITAPGAGAIWDKTAVEARVDPSQEQSKLGGSISKSVPVGEQSLLTLQNGYNVTQQGVVPVPGLSGRPVRSSATDQSARLSFGDSGTSVVAGQTLSSGDDKWLRKVGAEQKLSDGVTVSGSIGETAQGTMNKTISAGFKRSW